MTASQALPARKQDVKCLFLKREWTMLSMIATAAEVNLYRCVIHATTLGTWRVTLNSRRKQGNG